ncbi:MAG: hypothetical protein AMJ65_17950 [Phycisphaerae bacterium SG8_4]|nr:MAG: hypothetical protein AMJ65_17950 [Phycisphaerae bacterium SG8_4]
MCKRIVCLVLLVLMTSSISNAADVHWRGGSGNNLWTTPGNWEFNKVPAIGDNVFVNMPEARAPNGPLIQDGMELKINGLSCEVAGEPTMTMTGGTLEITDYIWWGDDNNSHGIFNMSGGTITVGNEFELGWGGGTGTWTMTGGEVTCGELIIPTGSGAAGELFLHGGTVNVGSQGLDMTEVGMIDVGDGTLVLDGDVTATVQGYIDSGLITAYGGGGRVILDFDRTNPGKTTLAAAWTGVAYNPNPKDGAYHPDTWANISWSADEAAVSHDVYFGDDFEDVDNGTGDTFRGNQGETFYVVGFPGFPYPEGLVPGTTYYWRIDEVEADGTVHKGDVWSFVVPPKIAYEPDPADGAEFVDPNAELSWTPGYGAKLHTVYFGTDYDEVSNATGGAPQGTATYSPSGPLDREKVYYWRVDEFDAMSTHTGKVWAFSTPGAVGSPDPANGAAGVQMTATLSWTPGETATSSEVYLGTDKDAVRNATSASPEYKGSRAAGSESLDPGKLDWHSTYYWRVDGIGAAGSVKGNVWSFETADFITVDDFESYNDLAEDDPDSNRIYLTWIDGFETTTNGAVVGYAELPLTEHGNVHGGLTSMPYSYDNNGKYSEANMRLLYPRDWTQEGVGVLSLWFNGNASNDPEAMYVVLNGTAVVYHDDPAATQAATWTRWTIDLEQFASQGVDLTNVDSIGIGFGDKNNVQAGGSGKMLFDDIALYRPAVTAVVGTLAGLADVTVADDAIVSFRYEGTEYVVADGDLMLGTTTRWYIDPVTGAETLWADGDPAPAATVSGTSNPKSGDVGSNADNFFFSIPGDADNISSIDGIDFQQTVFPSLSDTFFVFERGGNDAGTFQAILADGSVGEPVEFAKAADGGPYASTGVANGNQTAFGVVFKTSVPVMGVRITASGHDTLSISAVAAP